MPKHLRKPSSELWRNVEVPGSFSTTDFSFGVTISGQQWLTRRPDDRRQWRLENFVRPFVNSSSGFKFLVDLNWIDLEAINGIDNAPMRCTNCMSNTCE
jgi:hypothetical protein